MPRFSLIRSMRTRLLWLGLWILFSACAAGPDYKIIQVPEPEMRAYLADKPEELHPMYRRVLMEGRRNLVLNHMRIGLAAMELGHWKLAEDSFDIALLNIEAVYANDAEAAKARSLWHEEGRKVFKGEPYERAMAYYYRGLLYMRRGDFENARASFKGGLLQDAMAEEEIYRADFAMLVFLEGWASKMLGDKGLAEEAFREVKQLRPDFNPPEPNHNVLLIAETGSSPRKVAVGRSRSELVFQRGFLHTDDKAQFEIGGSVFNGYPMEDIYWQASTRGGREVDRILEGKAKFKETNETMGRALTDVSLNALAMAPRFGDDAGAVAIVAGIVGLVGLGQQAVANRTRTRADTRYWDNLPDRVHFYTFDSRQKDTQAVRVSFLQENGHKLPKLEKNGTITFINDQYGFAWVRSRLTPVSRPQTQ